MTRSNSRWKRRELIAAALPPRTRATKAKATANRRIEISGPGARPCAEIDQAVKQGDQAAAGRHWAA